MFDLPPSVVHSTISKMIINEELQVGYAVLLMLCCLCCIMLCWLSCGSCDSYVVSFQRVLLG